MATLNGRQISERTVLEAASAKTVAGTTIGATPLTELDAYSRATVILDVTAAQTEAGDTLDVFVDTSFDGGANWVNVIHFPQVVGGGGAKRFAAVLAPEAATAAAPVDVTADAAVGVVRSALLGERLRARWTIVDAVTTANVSFTFGVRAHLQV